MFLNKMIFSKNFQADTVLSQMSAGDSVDSNSAPGPSSSSSFSAKAVGSTASPDLSLKTDPPGFPPPLLNPPPVPPRRSGVSPQQSPAGSPSLRR